MMKILILGGTPEARTLAASLTRGRHEPVYAPAGQEWSSPDCPRCEPFTDIDTLTGYLQHQQIELLIDATDPYARTPSLQAFEAAVRGDIPLWGYQRPPWRQQEGDRWIHTPDWFSTLEISGFTRPLIALDGAVKGELERIPPGQQWLLWVAPGELPPGPGYQLLERHPSSDRDEALALLDDQACDLVVTRDLGGPILSPEVEAARARGLAVIFQARPTLPEPRRLFDDINTLAQALNEK